MNPLPSHILISINTESYSIPNQIKGDIEYHHRRYMELGTGTSSSIGSDVPDNASPLPCFNLPMIFQRLSLVGVPDESLNEGPRGLVSFEKNHTSCLTELVRAILPAHDEVVDENVFPEMMRWLQWLMLEDDPERALACLSNHQQQVCGVLGENCGDISEGFCSHHKAAEMQPLSEHVALSFCPVLDLLLSYWKDKLMLLSAESFPTDEIRVVPDQYVTPVQKAAQEFTSALVAVLLQFCESTDQNWLCVISGRLTSSPGLVEVLLRAERVMNENVIAKLHDLLVKLLAESSFKYEFAKAFVVYYPSVINVVIREGNDAALKKYPLLLKFSVLIFNMADPVTRLVEEEDLIGVLLQCLEYIITCVTEDRRLQVARWTNCYGTVVSVVEDIRSVMIHSGVPKYLYCFRRELVTKWVRLLASIQGMNSPKPETAGCHIEDGNANVQLPAILLSSISDICSLLVAGAFCMSCNEVTKDDLPIPSSALWLISECLQSLQCWLKMDNTVASVSYDDKNMLGERNCEPEIVPLLSVSQWPDISYDVSSQLMSVHIPLHRLLSMVLFRSIRQCYDESESLGLRSISADRSLDNYGSDFFGQTLKECHPYGFSAHVMEHPLRIRVFSVLVNAGMNEDAPIWYREGCSSTQYKYENGGSYGTSYGLGRWSTLYCDFPEMNFEASNYLTEFLVLSLCRSELDKELDLFLLQCSAALAPPDLFVERIVERFGLSKYLSLDFGDRVPIGSLRKPMLPIRQPQPRHGTTLVAEMLTLLIQIIKERRFFSLQRELMYKLSVGDTTCCDPVESLPDGIPNINQPQEVPDTVSERHAQTNEQLPMWSNICYPLKGVAKIATCKALLALIRSVMFYALYEANTHIPRDVVELALHLLSLALDVCRAHIQSGDSTCHVDGAIPLLAFASELTPTSPRYGRVSLFSLLKLLWANPATVPAKLCAVSETSQRLIVKIFKTFMEVEPGLAYVLGIETYCVAFNVKSAPHLEAYYAAKRKKREPIDQDRLNYLMSLRKSCKRIPLVMEYGVEHRPHKLQITSTETPRSASDDDRPKEEAEAHHS